MYYEKTTTCGQHRIQPPAASGRHCRPLSHAKANTYRAPSTLSREIHSKSRLCCCDWAPLAGLVFRKRLKRTDSQGENSCDGDRKMARWRIRCMQTPFFPNVAAASSPCSREAESDRLKILRRWAGGLRMRRFSLFAHENFISITNK